MKKWGILLGIVAIVSIISEVVAESKRLEAPIVLDVVIDFNSNEIYVSYLSNTIEPTMVEWVAINGSSYFPRYGGFDMFGGGEVRPPSYKDATYHSIYDATFTIHDVQREELLADAPSLEQAKIHFSGQEEAYEVDIVAVMQSYEAGFTVNHWENEGGEMSVSIAADETLTFTDIALVNPFGHVKALLKDGKTVTLPVTLGEGEYLQLELEETVGTYPAHQAYIRYSGSVEGEAFNEIRGSMINQPASAEWIKERVEQHHE